MKNQGGGFWSGPPNTEKPQGQPKGKAHYQSPTITTLLGSRLMHTDPKAEIKAHGQLNHKAQQIEYIDPGYHITGSQETQGSKVQHRSPEGQTSRPITKP